MLAAVFTTAAVLAQPNSRDLWRATELVPRQNFSGASAQHASSNLNVHLLRQQATGLGLVVKTCESFHQGELDAVLLALAGGSEAQLGEIYELADDNRRLPPSVSLAEQLVQERRALLAIREANHSLRPPPQRPQPVLAAQQHCGSCAAAPAGSDGPRHACLW
jgi:hypothetical protein